MYGGHTTNQDMLENVVQAAAHRCQLVSLEDKEGKADVSLIGICLSLFKAALLNKLYKTLLSLIISLSYVCFLSVMAFR